MIKSLLISFIAIVVSILSSLIGLSLKKISEKANNVFIGLSSGLLYGICFLEIIPEMFLEGNDYSPVIGIFAILFGLILIFFVDKVVDKKAEEGSNKSAVMLFLAIAIHNLPEGLAIGLSFHNGINLSMFIAILIHEVIDGLLATVSLLALNLDKKKTFAYSCLVALLMLPGIILGILTSLSYSVLTIISLGVTFSALVYVTSTELVPKSDKKLSSTVYLIVGIFISLLLKIYL